MAGRDLLAVDIATADDRAVLMLSGELDIAGAPRLRRALARLAEDQVATIELDLRDLRFIDSTGVAVLVGAARRAAAEHADVRVVAASPGVRKVLEMTGVLRMLAGAERLSR